MRNQNYIRHGLTKELYESGVYHMRSQDRKLEENLLNIPSSQSENYEFFELEEFETELVVEPENPFFLEDMRIQINSMFDVLTKRETEIIKLYFGLNGYQPHTLEEIGERFDLTRERVRGIREKAFKKIRNNSEIFE